MARASIPEARMELADGPTTVWINLMQEGADAWLSACSQVAGAWAAAGAAQADLACQYMKFWSGDVPAAFGLKNPRLVLRDELMFAETEAERFADAAREAVETLSGKRAGRASARRGVQPELTPLPE